MAFPNNNKWMVAKMKINNHQALIEYLSRVHWTRSVSLIDVLRPFLDRHHFPNLQRII